MTPDMRRLMKICESTQADHLDPFSFADHMFDACEAAEAGFYFDEGGCWGMALALHAFFLRAGLRAQIVVTSEDRHAMVMVNGKLYDCTGEVSMPLNYGKLQNVSTKELLEKAESYFDPEKLQGDVELASEIIANAQERATYEKRAEDDKE